MKLAEMIKSYEDAGYNLVQAQAKVAQDVVIINIGASPLKNHVTIKGGVVMHNISHDSRRATLDIDFDFIHYSLSDESIRSFIEKINTEEFQLEIVGDITELRQQDYHGKRVYLKITDSDGTELQTKLDIGVHKNFSIEQDEYCFDIAYLEDGPTLLVNSKEQMFTEKLRSILKFGPISTRYKDMYDMYFLGVMSGINREKLKGCIQLLIFDDAGMREEKPEDLLSRVHRAFSNKMFRQNMERAKKNWLDVGSERVLMELESFLVELFAK
ncbi:MAG TPA: hypothetical protein DEP57_08725 [Selenomonas sp.]|nr:hypothetical protein [Selenomonas sp.]